MARPRPARVAFEIRAQDKQASATLRRLSAQFTHLMRPVDRLNRKLRANQRALKPITSRLKSLGKGVEELGQKTTLGASAPIGVVGTLGVKAAADFEMGMTRVRAVSQATASEFEQLRRKALELGQTSKFANTEVAQGMEYLAMAGMKPLQILEGIPGMLNIAAAAPETSLKDAADFASNILTGFELEAKKMTAVSDMLTYGFTNANTTLYELHEALAKTGGIATKANLGLSDMIANVMGLADAGHKGETAGTALAGCISRIVKFSLQGRHTGELNEVTKVLSRLNIPLESFIHTEGPRRATMKISFSDFIRMLDRHGAALDDYMLVFGQEAGKYVVGLSGKHQKLMNYRAGLDHKSQGLSEDIAAQYMVSTIGAFQLFTSSLQSVAVAIGDTGLLDTVNALIRSISYLLKAFADMDAPIHRWVVGVGLALTVAGPLAWAIGAITIGLTKLFPVMALFGSGALAGFTLIGIKVIAITAAIGGLILGGWALFKNWDLILEKLGVAWGEFSAALHDRFALIKYRVQSFFHDLVSFVYGHLESFASSRIGRLVVSDSITDSLRELSKAHDLRPRPSAPVLSGEKSPTPIVTSDLVAAMIPRPSPLRPIVWEGFQPKPREWKFLPEFVKKGFEDVFGRDPLHDYIGRYSRKNPESGRRAEEIEVKISLEGGVPSMNVRQPTTSRARVSLDSGQLVGSSL